MVRNSIKLNGATFSKHFRTFFEDFSQYKNTPRILFFFIVQWTMFFLPYTMFLTYIIIYPRDIIRLKTFHLNTQPRRPHIYSLIMFRNKSELISLLGDQMNEFKYLHLFSFG